MTGHGTIEESITNQLRMVNFFLQGGNHARAAAGAIRAATLYAEAGRHAEAMTVVWWGLQVDASAYTAEQLTACLGSVGDVVLEPFRSAALSHLHSDREDAALALLQALIEADPEHATSRLLLADIHLRHGDNDAAIAQLWAAFDLFERFERPEGRIEVLQRILGIDGDDLAALRELARAQLKATEFEDALGTLTRLLQLRPMDRRGRELLAETLARSHRSGSAVAVLRSLIGQYERSGKEALIVELTDRALTWNPTDERLCVAVARLAASTDKPALPAKRTDSAELRIVG